MRLSIFLLPGIVSGAYVVPHAEGPYGVSIQDVVLTDTSLPDPYLNRSTRRIGASIIASTGPISACCPIQQPYLPAKAAHFWELALGEMLGIDLNHTISETTLDLCEPKTNTNAPLILFAPGAAIARQLYHVLMAQLVAQSGYTVVTFEQPGYVLYEEFPDGSVETQQRPGQPGGPIDILVQDVKFLVDYFNATQTAMWGHSEGGGITGASVVADPRLLGGINLDGAFYNSSTSILNHTTTTPFALFGREGHTLDSVPRSWAQAWQDMHGDKWEITLNQSVHTTYSDAPYLLDLYMLDRDPNANQTAIAETVGTIPGGIALHSVSALAKSFFDYCFGEAQSSVVVETAHELEWFTVQNVSTPSL